MMAGWSEIQLEIIDPNFEMMFNRGVVIDKSTNVDWTQPERLKIFM
jgi:hypothetical protein